MKRETRAIGRPLPPDLVAESVPRYVEACDECAYSFDPSERLYWSESIGGAFCSKACPADAWERREPVEAGEWIPRED